MIRKTTALNTSWYSPQTKPSKASIPSGRFALSFSADRSLLFSVVDELVDEAKMARPSSSVVVPRQAAARSATAGLAKLVLPMGVLAAEAPPRW